jgi:hypothetical protein
MAKKWNGRYKQYSVALQVTSCVGGNKKKVSEFFGALSCYGFDVEVVDVKVIGR